MKIDRSNYEQYFIDYLDGKMVPDQEKTLLSFLDFNPDLQRELEGLKKAQLIPTDYSYPKKDNLLKMVSPFEELCIDSMEYRLNEQEEKNLMESIGKDKQKQIIYKLYQSTKLIPDMNIRYPGKSKLKKYSFRATGIRILIPAAAAAILLIAWFVLNIEHTLPVPREISNTETQEQILIPEIQPEQDIPAIAEVQTEDDQDPIEVISPQVVQLEPKEQIRLARIQPIEASQVFTAAGIPSFGLMHKLHEDPYQLQQMALGRMDSRFQAVRNIPDRAKDALWKLADAGIRGLNNITEEEIEFSRNVDEDGRTKSLKLETSVFGIYTPLQNTGILQ